MVKIVDTKGKQCPLPIILTKKCIDESSAGDIIKVVLDNDNSKCNLVQYLHEIGLKCSDRIEKGEYLIEFEVSEVNIAKGVDDVNCFLPENKSNIETYIIVVRSSEMGGGEKELGEVLMRSYINSLEELNSLPKTIIFYNSAVKLLGKHSDTVKSLQDIERVGVEVICCGVCVDYYNVEVLVGRVSNMFEIGNKLAEATKIIYP